MRRLAITRIAIVIGLALLIGVLPVVGACAKPAPAPLPREVGIATYPVGMGGYVMATGWAKLITTHTQMSASVKPLVGPTVYTPQINAGVYDMGEDSGASQYRAYRGQGEYKEKYTNLRVLFREHVKKVIPLSVFADSGITKMSQLKGKRVVSDFGGNLNVHREVEVALLTGGLTWKDVIPVPVASMVDSFKAARDGRLDAFFAPTPFVPGVIELNSAKPIRFLSLGRPLKDFPQVAELLPGTVDVAIGPAGILKEKVMGITLPMWYASSTHFSEEAAYLIVKAIFENYKEIQPVYRELKNFTPEIMLAEPPNPYHKGAVRAYEEKGVWTKELDKIQKALLKL